MVEVDPNVILVAGTALLGLAIIFSSCLKTNGKEDSKLQVGEKAAAVGASSKPKKKKSSKSKTKSASPTTIAPVAVFSEAAVAPASKKSMVNAQPVVVAKVPEPAEEEEEEDEDEEFQFTPEIYVPAKVEKVKKAKETSEQKLARLEREKAKKESKKVEEEESATALFLAAQQNDLQSYNQASHPSFDGWAVVEKTRKNVKRNESTSDLDDVAPLLVSTPAAAPASIAPVASLVVDEVPAPAPIESVTKTLTVEARKLGLLIGPRGVTRIGLQSATATEISMPKVDKDFTGPVNISVTGTTEGVDRALFALNEMVVKGYSTILASPDFHEGYVEVKPKFLPDIIGKGGASIKAIQQHTDVKISTPSGYTKTTSTGETIVPSKVKIVLAGSRDKVALARSLILDLTKYYHTPVTHPGLIHVELDIPSNYFNYIIGAKGSEIKHIQANYKVTVYVPGADSASELLLIVGEEAAVQKAEAHIRRLVEKVDAQAAERAKVEAEGAALGEHAKARYAAGTAGTAAGEPRSSSRGPRAPRAEGAEGRSGKGSKNSADAPKQQQEKKEGEEGQHEEWMNEFAPRRAPINLGGMLPATAKFAAAPPALPAPASPVSAAADAAEEEAPKQTW